MTYIVTAELAARYGLSLEAAVRRLIQPLQRLGLLVDTGSGNAGLRCPPGPRPPSYVEKLGAANRIVDNTLSVAG